MSTKVEAKPRPISFTGDLVKAIVLKAKTETRRLMKPQPVQVNGEWAYIDNAGKWSRPAEAKCQYGNVGDTLYIRETLFKDGEGFAVYQHDGTTVYEPTAGTERRTPVKWRWKASTLPSIFMPRLAARYYLRIVGKDAERLQQIDEDGAEAEGVFHISDAIQQSAARACMSMGKGRCMARDYFRALWDNLNRKRGAWKDDPWVWAIKFKYLKEGVAWTGS